jgi:recombination protein RecT
MIGGILKKVRNSGELLSISAYVAYTNDVFEYTLGDDEHIKHIPDLDDRGKPRLVYAIAKTKDGGIYREVMTVSEIEKVRNVSRAKNAGPWKDWWDEMARKTVLRRLAKRLPMSSDLDDLVRRDDALYEFDGARARGTDAAIAPSIGLASRLDALAAAAAPAHDSAAGEIIEHEIDASDAEPGASQAAGEDAGAALAAASDTLAAEPSPEQREWFRAGAAAADNGVSRKALPPELRGDDRKEDAAEWLRGYDSRREIVR